MPTSTPAHVTLVIGDEELLAERAVRAAVGRAEAELGEGTEVEHVHAKALPDGFALGLSTPSLFGGGRVVVIDDAQELDAQARAVVLDLAKEGLPGTVLVLRAPTAGRQAKFLTEVGKLANVVRVAKLKPSERRAWAKAELRELGRRADERAVAAILELVGADLRELAGAVAKLHLAVPPPAPITEPLVRDHLTAAAERTVFEMTDAVFSGDAATALDYLAALFEQKEDPMRLLSLIAGQVRRLLQIRAHDGASPARIAQLVGIPEWQVKKALPQARRYRPEQLRHALDRIAEANAQIITGALPSRLLLETLVARLSAGTPSIAP
jgi:DNA polymerase-3 subunit delta